MAVKRSAEYSMAGPAENQRAPWNAMNTALRPTGRCTVWIRVRAGDISTGPVVPTAAEVTAGGSGAGSVGMNPVVPTGTPVGGAGAWSMLEEFSSAGKETTNDGALLPTVPARSPDRRRSYGRIRPPARGT